MATDGWTTSTYDVPDPVWPKIETQLAGRRVHGKRIPRRRLVTAALIEASEDPELLERLVRRLEAMGPDAFD